MPTEPTIRQAETAADYAAFARLCSEYLDWFRVRYADAEWFVDAVFGHQSLDAELRALPIKYGPPNGRTLLVEIDGVVVAGGAYRRWSDTDCEMKRLYVGDRAQGRGIGRRLCHALIDAARADGFVAMKLDTADRLSEAISLYAELGFLRIAPYQHYPDRLRPFLVFMERPL